MNDFTIDQDRDRLYSKAINDEEASLTHYGVLGMRWGHRKSKDSGSKGKKRKGKNGKKARSNKAKAQEKRKILKAEFDDLVAALTIGGGTLGMAAGALGAAKAGENWLSSKAFWFIPMSAIVAGSGIAYVADPKVGKQENPHYIGKDIERIKKLKSRKK